MISNSRRAPQERVTNPFHSFSWDLFFFLQCLDVKLKLLEVNMCLKISWKALNRRWMLKKLHVSRNQYLSFTSVLLQTWPSEVLNDLLCLYCLVYDLPDDSVIYFFAFSKRGVTYTLRVFERK